MTFRHRITLVVVLFILGALIALLHWNAEIHHYYWIYAWYDVMMHGLGGVWVGLLIAWGVAAARCRWPLLFRGVDVFSIIIIATLIIGIFWEVYEVLVGANVWQPQNIIFDTIQDMLMDATGATIAFIVLTTAHFFSNPYE